MLATLGDLAVKLLAALLPLAMAAAAAWLGEARGDAKQVAEVKDAELKAALARPADRGELADRLRRHAF